MKRLGELLLYKGQQLEKQNMLWNIAGSFLYAFASMVLSFLVMRIAGEDAGGVFAVGFSAVGQQMFTLAYFGPRRLSLWGISGPPEADHRGRISHSGHFCPLDGGERRLRLGKRAGGVPSGRL